MKLEFHDAEVIIITLLMLNFSHFKNKYIYLFRKIVSIIMYKKIIPPNMVLLSNLTLVLDYITYPQVNIKNVEEYFKFKNIIVI